MSSFLVTVCLSRFDTRTQSLTEGCSSVIIHGATEPDAKACCEALLIRAYTSEEMGPPKIIKTVAAPVLPDLLTEAGPVPIDWPSLAEEAYANLEATAEISHELGHWLDCDATVPADALPADADALRASLPEDISSGLNWQTGTISFFLISVLKPMAMPDPDAEFEEGHDPEDDDARRTLELLTAFPELADREIAVVVKARNAAVATWLWRQGAKDSPLAQHHVRLEVWPGIGKYGAQEEAASP